MGRLGVASLAEMGNVLVYGFFLGAMLGVREIQDSLWERVNMASCESGDVTLFLHCVATVRS